MLNITLKKFVRLNARHLFITLILPLCYIGGNYKEYVKSSEAELNRLNDPLKHDEKLWLYAQAQVGDGKNLVDLLTEIRNKVFWYSNDNSGGFNSSEYIPYIVDALGRDLEGRRILLPGHLLETKPSIVTERRTIQIIFPLRHKSDKRFLVFTHRTNNDYKAGNQSVQSVDKCSLSLENPVKSLINNNVTNLAILYFLGFMLKKGILEKL